MKSRIVILVVIAGLLALSACSSSTSAVTTTQASSGTAVANAANSLSLPLELAIGTLKLEGTANAVDAATAAKLLPLWKAVNTLGGSDTIAQVELDGLYQQIKETMTPAQVAAITAMHLTRNDLQQVAQAQGISSGQTAAASTSSSQQDQPMDPGAGMAPPSGSAPAGGGAGGPPADGGPGGGVSIPSSANKSSSTTTTKQVSGAEFYTAVIKLLESKIK